MKNLIHTGTSIVLATFLIGCGGSDNSSESANYLTGDPVPITTKSEAENAVSSVVNLNSSGVSNIAPSPARSAAPALVAVNDSGTCVDGGSYSVSGDATDTTADITQTYNNCNQYGVLMNGSQHVKGTNDGSTINLNMTMTDLLYQYDTSSSTMNMDVKYVSTNGTSLDMTMNGTASYNITSPILDSGTAGYQNFRTVITSSGMTLNGEVSTTSTVNTCVNGTYKLETLETLTAGSSGFTSGKMKINGATFDFNSDGTATVTFADNTTQVVDQGVQLVCN